MLRKLLFGLLCCALFFTIAAQRGKAYRADRFDVEVANVCYASKEREAGIGRFGATS